MTPTVNVNEYTTYTNLLHILHNRYQNRNIYLQEFILYSQFRGP